MSHPVNDQIRETALEMWREEQFVHLRDKGVIGVGAEVEVDMYESNLTEAEIQVIIEELGEL